MQQQNKLECLPHRYLKKSRLLKFWYVPATRAWPKLECLPHRYLKKSRLLKFCYVPAASTWPKLECLPHRYLNKSGLLKFCYVPAAGAQPFEGIHQQPKKVLTRLIRQVLRAINQSIFNMMSMVSPQQTSFAYYQQWEGLTMPLKIRLG